MPAAMKCNGKMNITAKKKTTKKPRKNPGGMLSLDGAKQALPSVAIGAGHAMIARQARPGKWEFFYKLSNGKKALFFFFFGMWLRKKGHPEKAGAAFALCGTYVEAWNEERKQKKLAAEFTPDQIVPPGKAAAEMKEALGEVAIPGSGYAQIDAPMGEVVSFNHGMNYDVGQVFAFDNGYQVAA
jgi:hypothetical protein